jgi:hypothetical protein
MNEQRLRQIIREELRSLSEDRSRRELRVLQSWLGDIADVAPGFDQSLAERVADHMNVRLSDEVFIEPLEIGTVSNLVNNPDMELVNIGNNLIVLFFGPDNPGINLSQTVAIGDNNGRPFWMLYSKRNAR